MKVTFLHQFERSNRERKLLVPGDRVIVAVSGGIDSVVLLDLLYHVSKTLNLQLTVAHFNHKLRGDESEQDESFVKELAQEYKFPFTSRHADTSAIARDKKESLQAAARDLRYAFFRELVNSTGATKIATAHNANDNAETILFNLLRGAGVKGLCGIPLARPDSAIVRPLLFATREQISCYAGEHHLRFREDSSNKKTEYSRNFLRHSVFPLLNNSINGNVVATLNRNAELFSLLDGYLEEQLNLYTPTLLKETSDDQITLDRELFLSLPEFMQYYALHHLVKSFTGSEISYETVKEMIGLSRAETGSWRSVHGNIKFYHDRNSLVLTACGEQREFSIPVSLNNYIRLKDSEFTTAFVNEANFSNNPDIEYIDASKLGTDLWLRNWRHGDWFIPLGMSQKKKLSDFFVEQKMPVYRKGSVPILTSDDSIVWICGQRLDERYKVTASTSSILKLEYKPLHE